MKHIIGAGLAGLTAALAMAPEPVMLITAGTLDAGAASLWSQGGIAAAVGSDDSPDLHLADTIAAGDGLCAPDAVARIIGAGPRVIERLRGLGVEFDRGLGLEAAHRRRRIVHVRDRTGLAITRAVARAVRAAPHVIIQDHTSVVELGVANHTIAGLWTLRKDVQTFRASDAVLIATGGIGDLYHHTSNPAGATGTGLALAAQAGAMLQDLEFVQFHPTGLDDGHTPMTLISEAVRGEGAILIDDTGGRFTAELAPRDEVSRAVFHHLAAGHGVYLDATGIREFEQKFPTIDAACKASNIDPAIRPIPIRPVAHYHMGGIAIDGAGRTNVGNLFAAGETACTGLHGANRLASNSLLEAYVTGEAAGIAMAMVPRTRQSKPPGRFTSDSTDLVLVRDLVSRHLGVLRDDAGLAAIIAELAPRVETDGAALIALMMALSARDRTESRGAHCRTDYPTRGKTARHSTITRADALSRAAAPASRAA